MKTTRTILSAVPFLWVAWTASMGAESNEIGKLVSKPFPGLSSDPSQFSSVRLAKNQQQKHSDPVTLSNGYEQPERKTQVITILQPDLATLHSSASGSSESKNIDVQFADPQLRGR